MNEKDCKIYENCLQTQKIDIDLSKDTTFHMLAVGCWGVYCNDGTYTIPKLKKNELTTKTIQRGQKRVSKSIIEYTQKNNITDMYLAGDNIYQDGIETKDDLEINEHSLREISKNPYNIDKQLKEGFENCFRNARINRFFLAVGNHDIENCDILSKQHNYPGWNSPSLYYNVVYTLRDFTISIIVLDTNMFEKDPIRCDKNIFTEQQIATQTQWAKTIPKCHWNIVIGHIPYLANGHKKDEHPIQRHTLKNLINDIKPDLYICADEHNQQYIEPPDSTPIVVAGSGGTALDKKINQDLIPNTLYFNSDFGFVSYLYDKNSLRIRFISDNAQFERTIKK